MSATRRSAARDRPSRQMKVEDLRLARCGALYYPAAEQILELACEKRNPECIQTYRHAIMISEQELLLKIRNPVGACCCVACPCPGRWRVGGAEQ